MLRTRLFHCSVTQASGRVSIAVGFSLHPQRPQKSLAVLSLQKVCIWKWTLAVETPACTLELPKEYGFQVR